MMPTGVAPVRSVSSSADFTDLSRLSRRNAKPTPRARPIEIRLMVVRGLLGLVGGSAGSVSEALTGTTSPVIELLELLDHDTELRGHGVGDGGCSLRALVRDGDVDEHGVDGVRRGDLLAEPLHVDVELELVDDGLEYVGAADDLQVGLDALKGVGRVGSQASAGAPAVLGLEMAMKVCAWAV